MMRGREREVERKKNNEKILNAQNRDRKFNKKQKNKTKNETETISNDIKM